MDLKELAAFRALSVEEVKLLKSPGRLPGSRVVAAPPTFPSRLAGQWLAFTPLRVGSPITVAGPRPILTAFPFIRLNWMKADTTETSFSKSVIEAMLTSER